MPKGVKEVKEGTYYTELKEKTMPCLQKPNEENLSKLAFGLLIVHNPSFNQGQNFPLQQWVSRMVWCFWRGCYM